MLWILAAHCECCLYPIQTVYIGYKQVKFNKKINLINNQLNLMKIEKKLKSCSARILKNKYEKDFS